MIETKTHELVGIGTAAHQHIERLYSGATQTAPMVAFQKATRTIAVDGNCTAAPGQLR